MLCFPLSHPRQRLRHRRAHGPAANTHSFRNFLLRKAEVVVGDDNRSLPFGKQREEPTHFESLENGGGRVVRGGAWACQSQRAGTGGRSIRRRYPPAAV